MNDEKPESPEVEPGNYQRQSIPLWFVVVSIVVAAWAVYYVYKFWGGLGPGVLP
jgi:hypothetical protein